MQTDDHRKYNLKRYGFYKQMCAEYSVCFWSGRKTFLALLIYIFLHFNHYIFIFRNWRKNYLKILRNNNIFPLHKLVKKLFEIHKNK